MSSEIEWGRALNERVGAQVKRLRGGRSAQWLAARTAELGFPIGRATISEIETGRRKTVSVPELLVLAHALDTAPAALVYPGPYSEPTEVLPGVNEAELWAVQWFSGLATLNHTDRNEYMKNTAPLRDARTILELREATGVKAVFDGDD